MTPMGRIYLNRVRTASGVDPKTGASIRQPGRCAALEAAIASGQPMLARGDRAHRAGRCSSG